MAFRWHPQESQRIALGPDILHTDIQDFCKEIESVHWLSHEITYDEDRRQWNSGEIDDGTKQVVEHILAFFSIADALVVSNINDAFMRDIAAECIDVQHVYIAIAEQERIHAKTYKDQPEALFQDRDKQIHILDAARTMPIITTMVDWIKTFMNDTLPIGDRLVAFVVVEGIWFTGSFCLIQWINQRNLLPGIARANEFISRDEGIHVRFACHLIRKYLIEKPTFERTREIMLAGLAVADKFVNEALPTKLAGMNASSMTRYLQFQTDCVMLEMGYRKLFNVKNPFDFMQNLCLKRQKNFFEKKVSEYQSITDPTDMLQEFDTSPIIY